MSVFVVFPDTSPGPAGKVYRVCIRDRQRRAGASDSCQPNGG